jgi:Xaa-Pro aminopeptidase
MVDLRRIHDPAAIAQLRWTCRMTAEAHRTTMAADRDWTTEAEVRGRLIGELAARGLDLSYDPIVTKRGHVLHARGSREAVAPGDLLLCDVGGEAPEGWAGDVTRTWPAKGRFTTTQREIYELVLSVQERAIERARPGVRFLHLHRHMLEDLGRGLLELGILRGSLEEIATRGIAALFCPHGLGHLLGLDVHDMEDLGDLAGYGPGRGRSDAPGETALRLDRDLAPGMLVTIEPGFYRIAPLLESARATPELAACVDWNVLERFADVSGIRIEDDVLICDGAAEVLSSDAPKQTGDVEH